MHSWISSSALVFSNTVCPVSQFSGYACRSFHWKWGDDCGSKISPERHRSRTLNAPCISFFLWPCNTTSSCWTNASPVCIRSYPAWWWGAWCHDGRTSALKNRGVKRGGKLEWYPRQIRKKLINNMNTLIRITLSLIKIKV